MSEGNEAGAQDLEVDEQPFDTLIIGAVGVELIVFVLTSVCIHDLRNSIDAFGHFFHMHL